MTTVEKSRKLSRRTLRFLRIPDKIQVVIEPAVMFLYELTLTVLDILKAVLWSMFRFFIPARQKSVSGEVVLVTGGGTGLGATLACDLARRGAMLVIWDADARAVDRTIQEISDQHGCAHGYVCDMSSYEEIYRVGRQVLAELGRVDILINHASCVTGHTLLQNPDQQVLNTVNVNLMAYIWTIKCFLPSMVDRNHGHIVNISSSAGVVAVSGMAEYSATKAGLIGLTETLCYELQFSGRDEVHTTIVCPYHVATGMLQGCTTKFPWLIPVLELTETSSRIVRAILTNQKVLYIPRSLYLLAHLKTLLPVSAQFILHRFLGASTFINNFVMRHKKDLNPYHS